MNLGKARRPRPGEGRAATCARQCTPLGLALFLTLISACAPDPSEAADRERFVRAYVALGEAEEDPAARDSVLAEHGTTPEQMTAFIRRVAQDPQRLARLWEEIRELEQEALRSGDDDAPSHAPQVGVGRDEASVEPALDVAEPKLSPEGVEEGLSRQPDDL